MKNKIILLTLLFLVGCSTPPQKTETTSNKEIQIDLLFKFKGYEMYRFKDAKHYRYFCIPIDNTEKVVQTSWNNYKMVGKVITTLPQSIMVELR